jgi:hypothetical protein
MYNEEEGDMYNTKVLRSLCMSPTETRAMYNKMHMKRNIND